MPAQDTANRVMASAKRLIDVRHSCRRRRRMAEIRVPAWPMPIHQTKLMMSKPQPTGQLIPQMPTPFQNSQQTPTRKRLRKANATPKPMNHQRGVFWRMTSLILSVTVPGVCPGATTAGRWGFWPPAAPCGVSSVAMLGSLCRSVSGRFGWRRRDRGIDVAQLGQVAGARPGVQLLEQAVVERVGLPLRDLPVALVDVAEGDRLGRAGLLAGGLDAVGRDRLPRHLG